jgi:hypothetical protein
MIMADQIRELRTPKEEINVIKTYRHLRYLRGMLGLGLPPDPHRQRWHGHHYGMFTHVGGQVQDYRDVWEFPDSAPQWIREAMSRYWSFLYWPMTLGAAITIVSDDQCGTYPTHGGCGSDRSDRQGHGYSLRTW